VIAVIKPSGISSVTSFKLWARAPTTRNSDPLLCDRIVGIGRRFSPDRYGPVTELGLCIISVGVPEATIVPPWTPAPGPMSST
jgi:hypothetical protein